MFEPTSKQKELLEKKLKLIGKEYYLPEFNTANEFQSYLEKLDKKIKKKFKKQTQTVARKKEKLYNYCIKLLDRFGLYTENKLREKMQTKTSNKEDINYVIEKLKEKNFINDERFAEIYINQQLNKGKGYYHIIKKLNEKGYTGDQKPLEIDEYESLFETLTKIVGNNEFNDLSLQSQRQKLLAKLQRKGYRYNLILNAIKELEEKQQIPKLRYQVHEKFYKEKDIQKDANKVIKKFNFDNLSDYNQKNKFIQKMLYRGYSYDKIKDYLNELES
ncbi:regulatory protein RecX [Candidatus Absconditicoccus praedator]|uniref:regulatory protein RecX n=1 Tax=Candidatus Absconditicoccus praedator TaxID=2735562 RepID=UPI001E5025C1|nr:regulatory protein RecX [Candidatus Absconditicoccus praedator]UFX82694.1 regulatory protein RecX [Candidatus Absconditicoccus praedator]